VIRTLGARHAGTKTKASSTRLSSLAKRRCASRSRFWAKSTPTLRRATATSALREWLVPFFLLLFGLTVYLLLLCMQTRVRDTCLFCPAACAHHALAWLVPFRPPCFCLLVVIVADPELGAVVRHALDSTCPSCAHMLLFVLMCNMTT
jgi:hypothetical protein